MSNVSVEGGAYGHGNPAYGQVWGQSQQPPPPQQQQPPPQVLVHPLPASNGGGNGGNGIPGPTLLPSGAHIVSYVDNAATKLPWWFWLGVGVAGYHFLVVRPVWKMRKGAG